MIKNIKKNKILNYIICIFIVFGSLMIFQEKIYAAETQYEKNHEVTEAQNNAMKALGINDVDTMREHMDFHTPDGAVVDYDYLTSINAGGLTDAIVVKYKNDEVSQKIKTVFGENGSQLQNYLNVQGDEYSKNLDKLSEIQKQITTIGGGSSSSTSGQQIQYCAIDANGNLQIKFSGSLSQNIVIGKAGGPNSMTPEKIQSLLEQWSALTGNKDMLSSTLNDLEMIISRMNGAEDVNLKLVPDKVNYNTITKVQYTIKNKLTGKPVKNAVVDQATTTALFLQYERKWAAKYKTITGNSCPSLTKTGEGTFEMDFKTPIMATNNPWKNIVNNWVANETASDFLGVAAFNVPAGPDPVEVNVKILGERCVYEQIVYPYCGYPTGHALGVPTSNSGSNYSFSNFNQSFYYGYNNQFLSEYSNYLQKSFGPFLNNAITGLDRKTHYTYSYHYDYLKNCKDDYVWVVNNQRRKVQIKNTKDSIEKVSFYTRNTKYTYSPVYIQNGYMYKGLENINGNADRPLYSMKDGPYVRDIWFKSQYIKFWNYKDELLSSLEVYANEPYVLSKFEKSSLFAKYGGNNNFTLVRFASDDAQRKGIPIVKEKTSNWNPPKTQTPYLMAERTWLLTTSSGKIKIPVMTRTGKMEGVINGADMKMK